MIGGFLLWFTSYLLSLRNRQQQSEHRSSQSNSGYRNDYDQYNQYQQQQAYPGYYSTWGFDQSGGGYAYNYQQYDYTQYLPQQVTFHCQQQMFKPLIIVSKQIFKHVCFLFFRTVKLFMMMDLKVCIGRLQKKLALQICVS